MELSWPLGPKYGNSDTYAAQKMQGLRQNAERACVNNH